MTQKRKFAAKGNATCNGQSEVTSSQKESQVHGDKSNATGPMKVDNNVKQSSNAAVPKKNPNVLKMVLRRSERLKTPVLPSENIGADPALEHVDLVENEKEEEALDNSQQVDTLPIVKERDLESEAPSQSILPDINEKSLEEKVDYLLTVVDELKSEVYGRRNEGSPTELSYKTLYFTSRKEIEALVKENYKLAQRLKYSRGKNAAYESMQNSATGSKEVYLLTPLGNTTEVGASLSPQAVQNCSSPPVTTTPANPNARKRYRKKKDA